MGKRIVMDVSKMIQAYTEEREITLSIISDLEDKVKVFDDLIEDYKRLQNMPNNTLTVVPKSDFILTRIGNIVEVLDEDAVERFNVNWFKENNIDIGLAARYSFGHYPSKDNRYEVLYMIGNIALITYYDTDNILGSVYLVHANGLKFIEEKV